MHIFHSIRSHNSLHNITSCCFYHTKELIGVPIFDRSTNPFQLTESGRIYIQAAQEILRIEQSVENQINNLNTLKTGHLSIGASNLFAAYVLPSLIAHFKQKYPHIDIRVTEGNTAQLEDMLSSNSLDFVIDNYQYNPFIVKNYIVKKIFF